MAEQDILQPIPGQGQTSSQLTITGQPASIRDLKVLRVVLSPADHRLAAAINEDPVGLLLCRVVTAGVAEDPQVSQEARHQALTPRHQKVVLLALPSVVEVEAGVEDPLAAAAAVAEEAAADADAKTESSLKLPKLQSKKSLK